MDWPLCAVPLRQHLLLLCLAELLTNTGASLELELELSQGERRQGMVSTTPLGWLRAGAGLKSVKYNPT